MNTRAKGANRFLVVGSVANRFRYYFGRHDNDDDDVTVIVIRVPPTPTPDNDLFRNLLRKRVNETTTLYCERNNNETRDVYVRAAVTRVVTRARAKSRPRAVVPLAIKRRHAKSIATDVGGEREKQLSTRRTVGRK